MLTASRRRSAGWPRTPVSSGSPRCGPGARRPHHSQARGGTPHGGRRAAGRRSAAGRAGGPPGGDGAARSAQSAGDGM